MMIKYSTALVFFFSFQLFLFGQDQLTATITGSGSPKFNTERAGPSVLISYKDTKILVDMGNGVQANLDRLNVKTKDIDALLFTHHHLDHNEEFTPIFIHALMGGNTFQVVGPKPTSNLVESLLQNYEEDINYRLSKKNRTLKDVANNFSIKELNGDETFNIGGIEISCTPVNHTIATMAYRFSVDGQSIVISGDLSYSESLSKLAKQTDYLIIDSGGSIELGKTNTRTGNGKNRSNKTHAHVNLDESSRMANEAEVKNLVLTHFNFNHVDEVATSAALQENYSGPVFYAEDLMTFPHREGNKQAVEQTKNEKNTKETPSFNNMLSKMDENKDGKISKNEAKGKLKQNFENRDTNKDGFFSENELNRRKR